VPSFPLDLPSADLGRIRTANPPHLLSAKTMPYSADQPYHAHIYFDAASRPAAEALASRFRHEVDGIRFVGSLKAANAGPHPQPQFEVHFSYGVLPAVRQLIAATAFTALIHPLTDDDLADHTTLAEWIGKPLPLDLSTLDPPGHNQGVARFGKADF